MKSVFLLSALSLSVLFAASCSNDIKEPEFSGERSFGYLVRQVEFGPRVPGSDASRTARAMYVDHFRSCGFTVDSQKFLFFDPYSGRETTMVNIVASLRGGSEERILFMAHYDCRPRADKSKDSLNWNKPIDGANDGASGVAVLMEIANLCKQIPPPVSVDLVLVDGEDWGKEGDADNYSIGSREFARRGIRDKYRFAIVVDLVGDKNLNIPREGFSQQFASELNDVVFHTAKSMGIVAFQDEVSDSLIDDHLPLQAAGVPAIDIIDFDYAYWHTEHDTPDKCSPQSLADVGRVLAKILYNPSIWPQK